MKLECEPSNPYDSKAIMFMCKLEDWKKIGYVVNEALSDVHQALSENSITSIRFAWVKVQWKTPGFYAATNITKQGKWSQTIQSSSSK